MRTVNYSIAILVMIGTTGLSRAAIIWDASNGTLPEASSPAWPKFQTGAPSETMVGTSYLSVSDDNLPDARENIQWEITQGVLPLGTDWYFESNIRATKALKGFNSSLPTFTFYSPNFGLFEAGTGHHGFVQMWMDGGPDGLAGGGDDTLLLTTGDEATTVLSIPLPDMANFHKYAMQKNNTSGNYEVFIDGAFAGSVSIASIPDAAGDNHTYYDLPGTGKIAQADYDFTNFVADTGTTLYVVPEPATLGSLCVFGLLFRGHRRR
jgi:hypothetical protein